MTERLGDFVLPSLEGESVSLGATVRGRRGGVVVFWSGVCSHCRRYDGYLNGFAGRHPELALLAVACREDEDGDQLRRTVREWDLRFAVVRDADRKVAHRWQVQQTPRVFLVDPSLHPVYRGAIDNFKYPRDPDYEPYLESAVAQLLAGEPIRRAETPSFGCPIESIYYSPAAAPRPAP